MTYAIRTDAWTRPDTLADMRNRHAGCLRMADDFRRDGDDACARLYEDEAAAEAARIALREDAERRFAWSRIPVHAVGDEIPDQTEGTGGLLWTLISIMAAVALVAWLVAGAADSGPHCPGADPAWLGACADAPKLGGAL